MKARLPPIHTLAFPALPIVTVVATNIDESEPVQAVRALAVILLLEACLLVAFYALRRNMELAAAMASLSVLYFFSYGHLVNLAAHMTHMGPPPPIPSGVIWLSTWLLSLMALVRLFRKTAIPTIVMNAFALGACILPMYRIVAYEIALRRYSAVLWQTSGPNRTVISPLEANWSPDIYYIILDGYGRQDTLTELYHFDNSEFLSELHEAGFFIANESRSNYTQTALSLASSMNMEYLDFLPALMGQEATDRLPLTGLIRSGATIRMFTDLGYQTVAFSTGYRRTEIEDADYFYRAPLRSITPTESLILEQSAFRLLSDLSAALGVPFPYPGYEAHREQIQFVLYGVSDLPDVPRPRFVFAHIIMPHPPFVFRSDGSPRAPPHPFRLQDGSHFLGAQDEYIEGYLGQVEYTNDQVLRLLKGIISQSERTPIIVLQGDHGPGLRLNWDSPDNSDLRERFGILNAYLLPGELAPAPHEGISPVNTFRLILGGYFGFDLPLLPDRSFYSTWEEPYRFFEFDTPS